MGQPASAGEGFEREVACIVAIYWSEHLRRLKVNQQGTLIAFTGRTEKRRSVGETDPDALRKVFEAAL